MREIRPSGSEGGGLKTMRPPYPYRIRTELGEEQICKPECVFGLLVVHDYRFDV